MDHSENDILISAYLDGELTGEERTRVEQLLASSGEARQLLDELRALRAGLQDLPQHRLELDFAQHVLQRAEREMADRQIASTEAVAGLATPQITIPKAQPSTSQSSMSQPSPLLPRRLPINRRGIIWSAVAVAAAVVVMVANRQAEQNRGAAEPAAEPRLAVSHSASQPIGQSEEMPALTAPAAAQPSVDQIAADRNPAEFSGGSLSGAIGDRLSLKGNNLDGNKLNAPSNSASAVAPLSTPLAEAEHDFAKTPADTIAPLGATHQLRRAPNNLVIVNVSLMPSAVRNGEFEQLLAKNHIRLEPADQTFNSYLNASELKHLKKLKAGDATPAETSRELNAGTVANSTSAATMPGATATVPGVAAARPAPYSIGTASPTSRADVARKGNLSERAKNRDELKLDNFSFDSDAETDLSDTKLVDAVYVVASPEQIQRMLAGLQQAPALFSAVGVSVASPGNLESTINDKETGDLHLSGRDEAAPPGTTDLAAAKKTEAQNPAVQSMQDQSRSSANQPANSDDFRKGLEQENLAQSERFGAAKPQQQQSSQSPTTPQLGLQLKAEQPPTGEHRSVGGERSRRFAASSPTESYAVRLMLPLSSDEKLSTVTRQPVVKEGVGSSNGHANAGAPGYGGTFGGISGMGGIGGGGAVDGREGAADKLDYGGRGVLSENKNKLSTNTSQSVPTDTPVNSPVGSPPAASLASEPPMTATASVPPAFPQRVLFVFRVTGSPPEAKPTAPAPAEK